MKNELSKLVSALLAASFLVVGANAIAGDKEQTQQPPVDCKQKPDDASCKDKK